MTIQHCVLYFLQAAESYSKSALSSISLSSDALAAVTKTDLVIEAIIENLQVKQELFSQLDKVAPQ